MNADELKFQTHTFPSPFIGEGLGVRYESGFEQRGALLKAFQEVLSEKYSKE